MASHSSPGRAYGNPGSPPARNASYSAVPTGSFGGARASSMSTTKGRGPSGSMRSARRTTGANSRSTSNALASPWAKMKATVSASRRMLSGHSTAPSNGTPKCASTIAGVFGAMMATVCPRWTPCRARAEARRRQRAYVSAQLCRRSPCRMAVCAGYTSAVRRMKLSGESEAWFAAFCGRSNTVQNPNIWSSENAPWLSIRPW